MIGDRLTDMQLAVNMGIRGILLGKEKMESLPIVLTTDSWGKIVRFLKQGSRQAVQVRKTAETEVRVALDLNGTGTGRGEDGNSFF